MDILRSLLGMLFLLLVAYLLSNNRRAVSGRTLIAALCTQLAIGALVLFVPVGRAVLAGAANGVNRVLDMGNHGIAFVFGGRRQPDVPVVRRRRVRVRPARAADDHLRDRTDRGAVLHRRDEVDRRDPRRGAGESARREPHRGVLGGGDDLSRAKRNARAREAVRAEHDERRDLHGDGERHGVGRGNRCWSATRASACGWNTCSPRRSWRCRAGCCSASCCIRRSSRAASWSTGRLRRQAGRQRDRGGGVRRVGRAADRDQRRRDADRVRGPSR